MSIEKRRSTRDIVNALAKIRYLAFIFVMANNALISTPAHSQTMLGTPQTPSSAVLPSSPVDLARPQDPIASPSVSVVVRSSLQDKAPVGADSLHTKIVGVTLDGLSAYTVDELNPYFADLIGRTVPLSALYSVARRIEERYRRDGYVLARVIVPEQSVSDGRFHLRIVEGYVGAIDIEGNAGRSKQLIAKYLNKILRGRPARIKDIERYLLLANDIPGISVHAVLTPDPAVPGAATLIADVRHKTIDAYATLDNRGSDFTGPMNASAYIGINGLTHSGGRIEALVFSTFDREQHFGELSYTNNIGSEGATVKIYGSYGPSRPGSTLDLLDIHSLSTLIGLSGILPLIRSSDFNLALNAAFEVTRDRTNILGSQLSIDRQRILRLGAVATGSDVLGGVDTASVTLHKGFDILDASHTSDPIPQSRATGTSDFFKLTAGASRLQTIFTNNTFSIALLGSVAGQYSANGLLALEQFRVGGQEYGRGYIPGELSGDDGVGASAELRLTSLTAVGPITRSQLYVFYDYGTVRDRGDAGGWHDLQSAGGGIRVDFGSRWSAEFELADPYSRGRTVGNRLEKTVQTFFRLTARY